MTAPGAFLGGAQDRLLPARIPFAFFIASAVFHVVAWGLLLAGAGAVPGYSGGLGPVTAALHALTLGVLAMTAMGAAYQLLPVATRQPLRRSRPAEASFWLFLPGSALVVVGMHVGDTAVLLGGGALAALGLMVFAALTADNLRRALDLRLVAVHGWGAMAALVGLVALGLVLIADFRYGFLSAHGMLAHFHMGLALFGFMGLLATGFSRILIPMFALSQLRSQRWGQAHLAFAALALAAFAASLVTKAPLGAVAAASALVAGGFHLADMGMLLSQRLRKRLGPAFVLIRAAWGLMALALILGLALALGAPISQGGVLFGFLVAAGWLLTFLLGVLQRILPFLVSMHATPKGGLPPLLSELAPALPLRIATPLHLGAVAMVAAGIVAERPWMVAAGSLAGLGGALAFLVFVVTTVRNARRR